MKIEKTPHNIKISVMVDLALKLRIDAAAAAAERSVSKYLQLTLSKIVPPAEPSVQMDIEEAIAATEAKPAQARRIRRIAEKATKSPRNKK